jgi:hypothetical protein
MMSLFIDIIMEFSDVDSERMMRDESEHDECEELTLEEEDVEWCNPDRATDARLQNSIMERVDFVLRNLPKDYSPLLYFCILFAHPPHTHPEHTRHQKKGKRRPRVDSGFGLLVRRRQLGRHRPVQPPPQHAVVIFFLFFVRQLLSDSKRIRQITYKLSNRLSILSIFFPCLLSEDVPEKKQPPTPRRALPEPDGRAARGDAPVPCAAGARGLHWPRFQPGESADGDAARWGRGQGQKGPVSFHGRRGGGGASVHSRDGCHTLV